MLVSESWLREWVQSDLDSATISEKLTLAGLEVEGVAGATELDLSKSNSKKLVVGRIHSCAPHPDANRLQICLVDIGRIKPIQIVCGAANAVAGMCVGVALPGAKLPQITITKSEIRGVESAGMLCSASELGLAEKSSGILALDHGVTPGKSLLEYLQLDDNVLELSLTPNRGDCLSIKGIGRELSVLTGSRFKDKTVSSVKALNKSGLPIRLEAADACPRFVGRAILGIDMQSKSPDWMCEKLRRSGLRSINPVVDITNYVMLETGQPMHAYDLDSLSDGIVVRMASKGEKLKLLDGSEIKLNKDNLVIADKKKAVALAGIMGGDNTAISENTKNIFFEAAFFSSVHILGKARGFGMHTDASHRFERGVDPQGQLPAIESATALLVKIAGGEPGKVCHAVDRKALPKRSAIRLKSTEIQRILGINIPAATVRSILTRLGMKIDPAQGGWRVIPPQWRFDISGQHDLIEEVGRCHGYANIPPRLPASTAQAGKHKETDIPLLAIKQALTEQGYFEVINYSFIHPSASKQLLNLPSGIMLQNPIADNMAEMRQSLIPGLLSALSRNLNRQESRVKLFECGNVFTGKGKKRKEIAKISGIISGEAYPKQWGHTSRAVDFFDIKGDLESLLTLIRGKNNIQIQPHLSPMLHPGQSASIVINDKIVGILGQLHPQHRDSLAIDQPVFLFEIDHAALASSALPRYSEISRYPAVQRDLAIVVARDVSAANVLDIVNAAAGPYLKRLELFDIYTGERIENNKKSFAFSLTFQSESSNLTSIDIDTNTSNIIQSLKDFVGAELRA